MTIQNYCMVNTNTNTCDNVCVWDGDPNTWTPPSSYLMLVQATTLSKIWQINQTSKEYELTEVLGMGGVGFTWDGAVLTTNEPKPDLPVNLQDANSVVYPTA